MTVEDIFTANAPRKLAYRLQIGKPLYVSDRAAYLGDDDVFSGADMFYPVLDLVRDVRNDLHGSAVVAARPFALDDGGIDFAGSAAVLAHDRLVDEALVVPQVQIRLRPVAGDKYLSMLEWAHGSRVNVDIWVHLYDAHPVAAAFQQYAERRGGDSLSK
ncbi:hypothetical protein SDC9_149732 [bioreactor metagenome]|uniref:Uncharacterized protein n=1 Tax=bioreactor metagenome TaxID=1076179 RepID=A0A645EM48_9ZZZZ